jgi:Lar family restriction alleviation protein
MHLEPCPFCGGEAQLGENRAPSSYRRTGRKQYYVACTQCRIRTPSKSGAIEDKDAQTRVADYWNTRVVPKFPAKVGSEVRFADLVQQSGTNCSLNRRKRDL